MLANQMDRGMDWDDTTNVANPEVTRKEAGHRDRAYLIVIAGSNVGEMHKVGREVTLGRSGNADIRLIDDGVSRLHCRIVRYGDVLRVEDLKSRNGTYCNGQQITSRDLNDGDKIQVGRTTILKFTYHDRLEETFQRQMFDSALRDPLTQAYNKRYFFDRLDSEVRFSIRHGAALTLFLLDLDHFKNINDSYGHQGGDKALVMFASHVRSTIRNEDVFARYGGEEFVIITRGIDRPGAELFAQRLREEIAGLVVEHDGRSFSFTTSIGVASLPENKITSADAMVEIADRALYQAKEAGRNQVVFASPGPATK